MSVLSQWAAHLLAFVVEEHSSDSDGEGDGAGAGSGTVRGQVRRCLSPLRLEPPARVASNIVVGKEPGHTNRLIQAAAMLVAAL